MTSFVTTGKIIETTLWLEDIDEIDSDRSADVIDIHVGDFRLRLWTKGSMPNNGSSENNRKLIAALQSHLNED